MSASSAEGVAPLVLREALGAFATGVVIVTTRGSDARPFGMTVNSFAAVSLNPPLVLWSAQRGVAPFDEFERAEYFAVHVLPEGQAPLSDHFARPDPHRFDGIPHRPGIGGVPLLENVAALFQCAVEHRYEGGDHLILVGRVLQVSHHPQAPLVYHGGRYRELA